MSSAAVHMRSSSGRNCTEILVPIHVHRETEEKARQPETKLVPIHVYSAKTAPLHRLSSTRGSQ
jgi:hypothetical protein